jgi:PTS system mannose-specific IIB component
MLSLVRLDDRLIHGQIMTVWIRQLNVNRIVVVDDASASDDFARGLMHAAMPKGITLSVHGVADAAQELATRAHDSSRTLVLFAHVEDALALHTHFPLPHLNIGNLGMREGRSTLWRSIAASPEERALLAQLKSDGVPVYVQMLPSDTQLPLRDT